MQGVSMYAPERFEESSGALQPYTQDLTLPYLRYPGAILASAGMSVDDVPTCRLRARLRQGLEKAVVSSINTSLWHDPQLSTPNCGTLR